MTYVNPVQRAKSFDDAVRIYNEIKPIKGKNAQFDIRPLGRRGNHAERIVKLDDNTYALWCDSRWWLSADDPNNKEDIRIRAAILWERTSEGDFVHVRNDWYRGGHVTHYRFMGEALPHCLSFYTSNGKQYVAHYVKGTRIAHFIPQDRWMGGSYRRLYPNEVGGKTYEDGEITPELVFKHKGGENFELVSKQFTAPKKLVDLGAKAELKDSIKAFKAWALLMAPMLNLKPAWVWPYNNSTQKEEEAAYRAQEGTLAQEIASWTEANGYGKIRSITYLAPKITRQIVQNEQHPLRVALAFRMLNECNLRQQELNVREARLTEKEARTKFNTAFNYHMNQILGLVEEK
jgi:hypothetical protein